MLWPLARIHGWPNDINPGDFAFDAAISLMVTGTFQLDNLLPSPAAIFVTMTSTSQ